MPEWLRDGFAHDDEISITLLVVRLAVALLLGIVVAGVYRVSRGKHASAAGLAATLVLLTVLIAMVTIVIGNSVARAFSLVGALAIVRFRTVVEDTRDTAFVIFAVGVGMAVGAGFLRVPLVAIPFATAAALLFRPRTAMAPARDYTLTVRVGLGHEPDKLLAGPFEKHVAQARMTAALTARQGAALDLTYEIRLRRPDASLVLLSELSAIEGVQSVELR
jgi:uncharacterized membrane protein YhiD involved in acid resistance